MRGVEYRDSPRKEFSLGCLGYGLYYGQEQTHETIALELPWGTPMGVRQGCSFLSQGFQVPQMVVPQRHVQTAETCPQC